MNNENLLIITWQRRVLGWLIHAFTASGAFIGILALYAIYNKEMLLAFWLMGAAIAIDAVDGFFARGVKIHIVVPQINGAILDNIVDFFTYTIVPSFFLLVDNLVPNDWRFLCVMAIVFSSSYQFAQVDAKTSDHFFKGFPSYWNIVIFYLFFCQMNQWANLIILFLLAILSFVPIKYIYPSRLDYLTNSKFLRYAMVAATVVWGFSTAGLLWVYPNTNLILVTLSLSYLCLYVGISLYRTWVPLVKIPNDVQSKEDY